jgi:hypothetical protein
MITCSNIGFNGRLANQMFQFASTVGIARNLGYNPKFPIENFLQNKGHHEYNGGKLLECFDIPNIYFTSLAEISNTLKYVYQESSFNFNPETQSLPDDINLNGYFQTERYFKNSGKEIRKIFTFRKDIVEKANDIVKIEVNSTCVHVRRGDYLSSPNHHPVQTLSYYQSGMEAIGDSKFYFFSDDITWCKENFNYLEDKAIFLDIENPYVSLFLMTQCKNHIMSNSSLSWWAAWLGGDKESQIVVAPNNWFGPSLSHNNTEDLYLPSWIKK